MQTFLNLGCGYDYRSGWINIDKEQTGQRVDMVRDLEDAELPFENNSVDFILCSHILEHIRNYIPLMKEIHRVLKPRGILHIKVPEFPCAAAISDPTHVRYFVPESFTYLVNTGMGYDSSGLQGLFDLMYLESLPHSRPEVDRHGKAGSYFCEIEAELEKL